MKRMRASTFKTHCLKVMDRIQKTGEPVVVTKRGKPVVKVLPAETKGGDLFGFLKDQFEIVGDIVSPAVPLDEWDALKQ